MEKNNLYPLSSAAGEEVELVAVRAVRLDKFLGEQIPQISRSYWQKILAAAPALVNGRPVPFKHKLQPGDRISCCIPEAAEPEIPAQNIPLDIIYEDADLLVVNKPKGMVVHPSAGHYEDTLVNALLYHCHDLSGINGVLRPGIVHRIDKDTTGLLVVCKNDRTHRDIAEQLKVHSISRQYRAIVWGQFEETSGSIEAPIGRHPQDRKKMTVISTGKPAVTHYQVIETWKRCSLITCRLETGRTHQIRVHMNHLHHPLLGDALYFDHHSRLPIQAGLQGQCLHAEMLGFIHPTSRQYMEFTAPLPTYFDSLIIKLRQE
ncbi:MAG: RluA family pseudouridine synthase [Lachnospiraceae bacterium]|nr:RluA family pseudouridine synthase [Lachnospiraceae bacterium]